jgi:hypothetical protein
MLTLGCAGQAGAMTVHTTLNGYLESGTGPNGLFYFQAGAPPQFQTLPGHEPVNYNFVLDFSFDPSLGHLTSTNLGGGFVAQSIDWQAAQGGLSPLLAASLTVFGTTYDLSGAEFTYDRNPLGGGFQFSAGGITFSSTSFDFSAPGHSLLLSDALSGPTIGCCTSLSVGSMSGTGYNTFIQQAAFGPDPQGVPIPEPATWAMLIAGLGGIGAMLRRRRAQLAIV